MRAVLIALLLALCTSRSVAADDIYTFADGKEVVTLRNVLALGQVEWDGRFEIAYLSFGDGDTTTRATVPEEGAAYCTPKCRVVRSSPGARSGLLRRWRESWPSAEIIDASGGKYIVHGLGYQQELVSGAWHLGSGRRSFKERGVWVRAGAATFFEFGKLAKLLVQSNRLDIALKDGTKVVGELDETRSYPGNAGRFNVVTSYVTGFVDKEDPQSGLLTSFRRRFREISQIILR
jgi:hypothetical protein